VKYFRYPTGYYNAIWLSKLQRRMHFKKKKKKKKIKYMYTQYFTFTWSLVSGVRVTRSLIWCVCVVWIVVCPFVLFLLAIVLYVLRYADSDYSCGIFKLFYNYLLINSPSVRRSFTNLLILQGCFSTLDTYVVKILDSLWRPIISQLISCLRGLPHGDIYDSPMIKRKTTRTVYW
jgi:hypothetical protein